MAPGRPPVDARSAKKRLRLYAVMMPLTTLIGGWCALLTLAWIAFPEGVVDHIPIVVKGGASAAAAWWLYWSFRMVRKLPSLIDDILERGLSLDDTHDIGHWLGRTGRSD
ncbi:MAG: hypothetical protein ACR2QF_10360 [Geminicoccaceae bacterium]